MIRLPADERRRLADLKREARAIKRPFREAARKERKVDAKARGQRSGVARRDLDDSFLAWLRTLHCIACDVLGPPKALGIYDYKHSPIEAAHQKLNAPERGVQKRMGVRPSDYWCVPLCVSHHRIGIPCCDPAQAKFWAIIGLTPTDVADFCRDLYAAFEAEADGDQVVANYASLAAGHRADAASLIEELTP
jgi:hypothetical protein